jgi:hypothetical protein
MKFLKGGVFSFWSKPQIQKIAKILNQEFK